MKKLAKYLIKQAFAGDYTIKGNIEGIDVTCRNRDKSLAVKYQIAGFKLEYTFRR